MVYLTTANNFGQHSPNGIFYVRVTLICGTFKATRSRQVISSEGSWMEAIHQKLNDLRHEDRIRGLIAEIHVIILRQQLSEREISVLHRKIADLTDALRDQMTRTYEAEHLLIQKSADYEQQIQSIRKELAAALNSRSYRVGRRVTAPLRLIRRIVIFGS